jgi:hypothetical protein
VIALNFDTIPDLSLLIGIILCVASNNLFAYRKVKVTNHQFAVNDGRSTVCSTLEKSLR